MGELKEKWAVTYQYHDYYEAFFVKSVVVEAESLGLAIDMVDKILAKDMDSYGWSDYHITSVNIIPELH